MKALPANSKKNYLNSKQNSIDLTFKKKQKSNNISKINGKISVPHSTDFMSLIPNFGEALNQFTMTINETDLPQIFSTMEN